VVEQLHTHPPPRARPVADAPVDALLGRADELARRWAIALILARPLDAISDVPLEELAHEAPALCAQLVRAMQSDIELERLTAQGAPSPREHSAAAPRLAAICGARDPAAVVQAVEALRGVLWEALLDHLNEPSARLLADVSDRLAHVCAAALAAAVDLELAPCARAPGPHAEIAISGPDATARDSGGAAPAGGPAVIVDERAHVAIKIRDERSEQGPAAWIRSLGAQLERFKRDRLPFAVLLIELVDSEGLRLHEHPEELSRVSARVEQVLALEPGSWPGSLTRERPGRWWLLAPEADRAGARELAERIARAVASHRSDRQARIEVAIGTAVCPTDGQEAAALAAHADVGLYAARAAVRAPAGRPAAPVDESA